MPNHIHLPVYTRNLKQKIDKIIGNVNRFMAYGIVKTLNLEEKILLSGNKSVLVGDPISNRKSKI